MFTHLNNTTNVAFTTGETVTGGTSGSTGIVQSITSGTDATISGALQANPVVITSTGHTLKEGQQITIDSVAGMTDLNGNVYTVRNPGTDNFELYDTNGTSSIDGTGFGAYTSGGLARHGVVVISSVSGSGFSPGETITGGTSTLTAVIQANAVGWNGVTEYNTSNIKHSKENLSIPANKIVIGYFQKDGIGWGEGNEPKLIKGPDIFCDVVVRLSKKYDIFILLTGPARGYVKNYLRKENIAYGHEYLEDPNKVANYYSNLFLFF